MNTEAINHTINFWEKAIIKTFAKYYTAGLNYRDNKVATDAFLNSAMKNLNDNLKDLDAGFQIKKIYGRTIQ